MASEEFVAQCWGGPEHGNVVSASEQTWEYSQESVMWLVGAHAPFATSTIKGHYQLSTADANGRTADVWVWHGQGADGDTIERMRQPVCRGGSVKCPHDHGMHIPGPR